MNADFRKGKQMYDKELQPFNLRFIRQIKLRVLCGELNLISTSSIRTINKKNWFIKRQVYLYNP
ncbi:hypothetical protein [Bacteroides nordii]|uniref:hypothetical protein n=1 Tax=Bacteroides nordii TaxID=291645 RepID=UPI00352199EC